MKFVFFLLITLKTYASIEIDTTFNPPGDTTSPTASMYLLELAGKAKFKDSVRFQYLTRFLDVAHFTNALIETLRLPIADGILQVSEQNVFSGAIAATQIGSVATGRVTFGDSTQKLKTSELFRYEDSTGTLFVPNIVIGEGGSEGLRLGGGFAKIKRNFTADDRIETIFVDTSDDKIEIDLKPPKREGKSIFIKRVKGKHSFIVNKEYKAKDDIKLIWDGSTWIRL